MTDTTSAPAAPVCAYAGREVPGEGGYRTDERGGFVVAEPVEPVHCELCGDTGFYRGRTPDYGYEALVRCTERVGHERHLVFNRTKIPARFHNARLDTFQIGRGRHLGAVLQAVDTFVANYVPGEFNRGMVLYGKVGMGKTHLAVGRCASWPWRRGWAVASRTSPTCWPTCGALRPQEWLPGPSWTSWPRWRWLLIDELGKGRKTDWELGILDELITRRYNERRTVLFTTNFQRERPNQHGSREGSGRPWPWRRAGPWRTWWGHASTRASARCATSTRSRRRRTTASPREPARVVRAPNGQAPSPATSSSSEGASLRSPMLQHAPLARPGVQDALAPSKNDPSRGFGPPTRSAL